MYAWLPYILSTLAVVAGMAFSATDFQLLAAHTAALQSLACCGWRVLREDERAGQPHAMLLLIRIAL